MIIGICGWIGTGKDSIADYLVSNYSFERESFASSLKDAVAVIFGWDREMLEGKTAESRQWREQTDFWWAQRLNIPNLTPRWVLQYWGTEVCRNGFHNEIWISSLENKLRSQSSNVVITDCRFPNEVSAITKNNGYTVWVQRGPMPDWYHLAKLHPDQMPSAYPEVHASEYQWLSTDFDFILDNSGTFELLHEQIDSVLKNIENKEITRKVLLDLI